MVRSVWQTLCPSMHISLHSPCTIRFWRMHQSASALEPMSNAGKSFTRRKPTMWGQGVGASVRQTALGPRASLAPPPTMGRIVGPQPCLYGGSPRLATIWLFPMTIYLSWWPPIIADCNRGRVRSGKCVRDGSSSLNVHFCFFTSRSVCATVAQSCQCQQSAPPLHCYHHQFKGGVWKESLLGDVLSS